jgi:pyruvate,water dikinase
MLAVVGRDGGLVTEVGGLLAHGAIYAREIGMAAVLNVPRITACIQTGTRIRISGKENLVEILD